MLLISVFPRQGSRPKASLCGTTALSDSLRRAGSLEASPGSRKEGEVDIPRSNEGSTTPLTTYDTDASSAG